MSLLMAEMMETNDFATNANAYAMDDDYEGI